MLITYFLSALLLTQQPEPVKIYCTSPDIEAGFNDGYYAKGLCEDIYNKDAKKNNLFVLVETQIESNISIIKGATTVSVAPGETTHNVFGMAWAPTGTSASVTAVLVVGNYTRSFQATTSRELANAIRRWIVKNKEIILEKTK